LQASNGDKRLQIASCRRLGWLEEAASVLVLQFANSSMDSLEVRFLLSF